MARFRYSAILESGQEVSGVVKSAGRGDALTQLLSRGYHPRWLEPMAETDTDAGGAVGGWFGRVKTIELGVFTRQMATLLRAGIPVVQALSTLGRQSENRRLLRVIGELQETLSNEGKSLAEAMEDHPRVFDPVYRSLVRAGEESGGLPDVMDNLAKHLMQSGRIRGQVVGAFIYPIFLLLLGATAIFVLMTFVIPRFNDLFASFQQKLPWPTRFLLGVSDFLSSWWWVILAGLGAAVLAAGVALRRPAVRRRADGLILRLPVFGKMLRKLSISRIARTLSALLGGGVAILTALRITGETCRNRAIRETFPSMIESITTGDTLAIAAEKTRLYPPLMLNLVRTGEETGELPGMLNELSMIYEEEAERAVSGAIKLLEPVLIVVMGLVISGIVGAVMLPLLKAGALVE
ncbi:MAG: type II secretion system F family protein [Planctomycetota bacterium]|nr:type II secretion system F family protein [Planctomycetota bacterium]